MIRTYEELLTYETFDERFDYLKLWDTPHVPPDDALYRKFLKTSPWLQLRDSIIERDVMQDLGVTNRFAEEQIIVHHLNPVTTQDLVTYNVDVLLNPNNLITTTISTHNAIHYKPINKPPVVAERSPGDTNLW